MIPFKWLIIGGWLLVIIIALFVFIEYPRKKDALPEVIPLKKNIYRYKGAKKACSKYGLGRLAHPYEVTEAIKNGSIAGMTGWANDGYMHDPSSDTFIRAPPQMKLGAYCWGISDSIQHVSPWEKWKRF